MYGFVGPLCLSSIMLHTCRAEACSNLSTIRLDELQLQVLSTGVLAQLAACRRLYLQHNCLTSCSAVAALPQLTMLFLADNHLQQVTSNAAKQPSSNRHGTPQHSIILQ